MSPTAHGPSSGRGRSRLRLVTSAPPAPPDAEEAPSDGGPDLLDPSVRRFSGRDASPGRAASGRDPRPGRAASGRDSRPGRAGSGRDSRAGRPGGRGPYSDRARGDDATELRATEYRPGRRDRDHETSSRTGGYPGDGFDDPEPVIPEPIAPEFGADGSEPDEYGEDPRAEYGARPYSGRRRGDESDGRGSGTVAGGRPPARGAAGRGRATRGAATRGTTAGSPGRGVSARTATTRRTPARSASGRAHPARRPHPRRSGGGGSGTGRGGLGGRPPRPPRPFVLASPRRRVRVAVVLMVAVLVVLAGRLAQLQGFASSTYAEQAEQQRLRKYILPAARGMITDRHGYRLAQDVERRAVYADPLLMAESDVREAARRLAPLLGEPESALRELMSTNDPKVRFVYLHRDLDRSVGDEVSRLDLRGIGVVEERGRVYPSRTLGANFVGYSKLGENDTIVGSGGLELAYDDVLRGTDGRRQIEADPAGREIPSAQSVEKDPVSGSTLRLTIDRDIQWDAQNAIAEAVRTSEAAGGTIVVMDPKTGDLLALADAPQFDPNNITRRDTDALGNRSTGQAFEPGSVNKVITMAAALDRGLIDAATPITVPPSIERGGETIRDSAPHGTEHLTAAGVLARSSNIGTVLVAEKVGTENLEQTMRAFGLGKITELDFPGETAGILPPAAEWSGSQAATISYGQGTSATAVQMASVYATVANGGMRVAPRLVDAITGPDGVTRPTARAPERRVISPETASTLTRMLEAVATTQGTAPAAEVAGYRVAGKTGTAYRPDPVNGGYKGYVSSFIGFAPADNPQVVVEVVLDDPKKGFYGGQVAAPVFARVMSFALNTLGVPPPGTQPEPLVLDLDR